MKTILTGDRPTGKLHLGHYFGSLENRVKLQYDYDTYILIADVQALTDNFNNPEKVREYVYELALDYLGAGIDPKQAHIYIQSLIPEVAELTVYFSNLVSVPRLYRNPTTKFEVGQKKSLFGEGGENITYGFLGYPVSQAADIACVNSNIIPVGEDQLPHIEQAREILRKFNSIYGETFNIPEPLIPEIGARIKDLQEPTKKMSKSSTNEKAIIRLLDEPEVIRKKIMSAVTDSDNKIYFDEENKPGISNLLTIYSVLKDISIEESVNLFKDSNYGTFKKAVADIVVEKITNLQNKYNEIINSNLIDEILDEGYKKTNEIAKKKYYEVKEKVGLGRTDNIRLYQ